jgi:hypothetical protein
MNHPNIVICFIGGSGGHFVAAIVEFLLYGHHQVPRDTGSYHNLAVSKQYPGCPLPIVNTPESFTAEYEEIQNLPDYPIILGHFRNLALLQSQGKKVIYITYSDHHRKEINRRVRKKVNLTRIQDITQEQYNILKGSSWPSFDEFKDGAPVDELDDEFVMLKDKDPCLDWMFMIPAIGPNICCIDFEEILTGYSLVERLTEFLDVKEFNKTELIALIDNYRKKQ